jgi:predicted phage tail protein
MSKLIRGAGGGDGGGGKGGDGGGGSQRTPTEAANSLFSTSYAKLIDLVSEGEIFGLVDGLKSVYVDNTPLQNADNSYNFQNVSVYTRNGTQSQSYIPGFDEVANEVAVGVTVQQASPVVRTITNTAINAARLTITVPQLQQFTDQGDINGTSINLQIAVQYNSGGFTTVVDDIISGRTGQQYQRQYLVSLSGAFPIDIKVTRVTADSGSSKLINAFSWSSYTEVTYAKLAYPNSALVGVRIDAEQFNSIPSRSYRIKGIKVKIPSNGTVNSTSGAISYSGIWDGTFGAAQWTSDPAWCLWDLLTARYGFKDHIDTTQLDKWAFYSASQYCGASVPDGFGGAEPRFSCNVNIQTADDAYKLINEMCSVFRAMPYWSTGALTVSQDKPSDPAYLFTYANVSEEGFSYNGSSLKTRPTVAVVQYMDLSLRNTAYEVVEDQTAISKYGVIKSEITAFACTSRGQAHRIGEWLLYSSQYETETVSFMASIDAGVLVRPGQIIEISDPVRAGARRGGRIRSATTTAITVDDAAGLSATNTPILSVILGDGTVQARAVSSVVGNVITVATAFGSAPNANSVWIFETTLIQTTTWRVLGIQEQDQCKYAITALAYNSSKYDYIERGVTLQTRSVSNLNAVPAAPTNLSLTEALYSYQSQVRSKIIVSWQGISGINSYLVKFRKDSGNWTTVTRQNNDYEILDTTPGLFEINIYSLSAGGQSSATALSGTITALGKTAPPSDVSGFTSTIDPNIGVVFTWSPIADIDVAGYEIRRGSSWAAATLITQVTATSYKLGALAQGNYTYLIKAFDTSGSYSINAASTVVTVTPAAAPTIAQVFNGSNVVLSWTAASGSLATAFYELRVGGTFSTATVVATVKGTAYTVRGNWSGAQTYWVVAVDGLGGYGTAASVVVTINTAGAPSITAAFAGNDLVLTWAAIKGTLETAYYKVLRGSTFAGATLLGSVQGTSYTLRVDWGGSQTFWVAAFDVNDAQGTPGNVVANVTIPSAPTISQQVIDNNVLMTWTDSTQTLPLTAYELRRGSTWAGATVIGTKQGRFTTVFETASGTYTYWLAGIDSAGNYGTPGSVVAAVNQPPDYVLQYNQNSTFSGTKTNLAPDAGGLLASVNTSETWQSHFTSRSWSTPQDQINAGYPFFAQPSQTTAQYLEEIDYGTVLAGTKVTATLNSAAVAGATTITPSLSIKKLSSDAWTVYSGVSSVYGTDFRYIRVQYDFASSGGDDLLQINALNIRLDSKEINDSGTGSAVSTDSGGTVVNFSRTFVDVSSIMVTPLSTSALTAVYDFVDTPNPASFKVLIFNSSGARVSSGFSWSARGV